MTAIASVPYLLRRGNRFSFRRVVPQHLASRFGRREVKLGLSTVDLSVARRRARTLANRFEEAMEMVENNPQLTIVEIDKLVRQYMAREWARAEREVLNPDLDREQELENADLGIDALSEMIKGKRFQNPYVRQALQDSVGESLPPDGPLYRHAANVTLRANLESLRLRAAMIMGDYRPPTDPLFDDLLPDRDDGNQITVTELFEAWQAERQLAAKQAGEWRRIVRRFAELHGDMPVRSVEKRHVVEFKDKLFGLPCAIRKAWRELPMPELIQAVPNDVPKVSATTVKKYLGVIHTMLSWGVDNGYLDANPANKVRVAGGKKGPARRRVPLTNDELSALFNGPVFNEGKRPKGGGGEAIYWVPLMALFMGARQRELCQLRVGDVREEGGIAYIDINPDGAGKSVKTHGSCRKVPIHPTIIGLGFLDYVATRKTDGPEAMLFPLLKPDSTGNVAGVFSKAWNRYMGKLVPKSGDCLKDFHSLRHTFKDACRSAGIDRDVHDTLTGHSDGSVSSSYGDGVPLKRMAEGIGRVAYSGLNFPPNCLNQKSGVDQ